jgi:N-acyl-D-aspartate/D-glutamate deacylase
MKRQELLAMAEHDLVIRGGQVLDGTGSEARTADVAIKDDKIVEVGHVAGTGTREIDADGALVAPGWVDIHTHYDGQVTWENTVAPSSWLGVTSVVMSNCGVGFAPCKPEDRQTLIELMEGVEDIPGTALSEGITWEWETFTEYLDALDARQYDIDIAAQVPHGALRLFVMGQRGADREAATPEEIAEMGRIVAEAVDAGAMGWSTSRLRNHRTIHGDYTPDFGAAEAEFVGIAAAMGATGKGFTQVVTDFDQPQDAEEFDRMLRVVEKSGRPMNYTFLTGGVYEDTWRDILRRTEEAAASGLPILANVAPRALGAMLGLDASLCPFTGIPEYDAIAKLPLAEKVALMRVEKLKDILINSVPESDPRTQVFASAKFEAIYELGDPPNYEPKPEDSLLARAQREGRTPSALAYDLMMRNEGTNLLYVPFVCYGNDSLDQTREALLSDASIPSLGDGGAHVATVCDASFPTFLITHWCRDRTRGEGLPLPFAVMRQTRDSARAIGLLDRGVLSPGYKADVNVIDFDRLQLRPPEMHHDLPAGGRRLLQRADGYVTTIASGQVIYESGEHTGALPGRLIRGPQAVPSA